MMNVETGRTRDDAKYKAAQPSLVGTQEERQPSLIRSQPSSFTPELVHPCLLLRLKVTPPTAQFCRSAFQKHGSFPSAKRRSLAVPGLRSSSRSVRRIHSMNTSACFGTACSRFFTGSYITTAASKRADNAATVLGWGDRQHSLVRPCSVSHLHFCTSA